MQRLRYMIADTIDIGTPDDPKTETKLRPVVQTCLDANLEHDLAVIRAEAYNGEVTVEDAGPDPVSSDPLAHMAAAYYAGVQEA